MEKDRRGYIPVPILSSILCISCTKMSKSRFRPLKFGNYDPIFVHKLHNFHNSVEGPTPPRRVTGAAVEIGVVT